MDGFSLREKDLNRHLEKGGEAAKSDKDKKAAEEDAETKAILAQDNQLRMALQFVKTLPALRELHE